jgi:NADH:ubiquinone oxidoreductase subunit E
MKIRYRKQLFICSGKACSEKSDPQAAKQFFKDKIREHGLKHEVRACTCSCLDYCDEAPNMVLYPEGKIVTASTDWEQMWKELSS